MDKKIKLTIIMDNYVREAGLLAEHGWSLLIETGEDNILFDTGADNRIINNLKQLGFTAHIINKIFISHGHYDHTGGLYDIARSAGRNIELFAHPAIFDRKYKLTKRLKKRYIGIPYDKEVYSDYGVVFRMDRKPLSISENIYSTGEIEQAVPFERSDINFIKKRNGFNRFDDLRDDTSVIIDTKKGLILITGCAHRGLISTIRQSQKISGKDHFLAVIGGFHLSNKKKEYIDKTVSELKKTGIDLIVPSHCTGMEGYFALKKTFGKRCEAGYTGKEIII